MKKKTLHLKESGEKLKMVILKYKYHSKIRHEKSSDKF